MKKKDEIADPNSCWNKAGDDEVVFILLARDLAAPGAIHAWIKERIRLGKNTPQDAQLAEAQDCAMRMVLQARERVLDYLSAHVPSLQQTNRVSDG